jgi:predicted DNA-binding transcriptional regulator YafY
MFMPRQEGQKGKMLVLLRLFTQYTDEEHPLSVPQLARLLAEQDISAERKSIYTDIEALRDAGYAIELQRGRGGGYYLAERTFQLPELKLLVDAVQASRFITRRQSDRLIHSLEGLASQYQARQLQRQVFVSGRAKNSNETGYYAVDALYQAIAEGKMVSFRYMDWTLEKKKAARNGGTPYCVSPWALVWENNCYYLIAYQDYSVPANIRHYRVDKMGDVRILDEARRGSEQYAGFDLAKYVEKMFGMYGGREESVTLRCENAMAGAMLDRFGTQIMLMPEADGAHFHFTVRVMVSPQFLGWICGFAGKVTIAAPETVRTELLAQLEIIKAGCQE